MGGPSGPMDQQDLCAESAAVNVTIALTLLGFVAGDCPVFTNY
jgi:hypothetical protein